MATVIEQIIPGLFSFPDSGHTEPLYLSWFDVGLFLSKRNRSKLKRLIFKRQVLNVTQLARKRGELFVSVQNIPYSGYRKLASYDYHEMYEYR